MSLPKPLAKLLLNVRKPRTCILSYPKSGRTWLRVLIGKALCLEHGISDDYLLKTRYITAASGLPLAVFRHDQTGMTERLTFEELDSDKTMYTDKKVVLMTRDIRDTLVSAYFQATRRTGLFKGPISGFLRDERFGVRKIIAFHRIWSDARNLPDSFLHVRYEDLHHAPQHTLLTVLEFMGARKIDPAIATLAVRFAAFRNLQRMERHNAFDNSILSPSDPSDPESFKVRQGRMGGYRQYLDQDDLDYIDARVQEAAPSITIPCYAIEAEPRPIPAAVNA